MKTSALILIAALVGAAPAFAQPADPGTAPSAAPDGRPAVSPQQRAERRAAMQKVMQACQADMQTLCGGQQDGRGGAMMCMRQNRDKVSQGCKDAMGKIRMARGGGFGGRRGGGFGAPAPGAAPPASPQG